MILEERGLFWWADEIIPDRQWAPENCVAGLLTIDEDGVTNLDLDRCLPNEHGPMSALANLTIASEKAIRGLLKTSSKQVFLFDLQRNGGEVKSNGISYEVFNAWCCFVCDDGALPGASAKIKRLSVRLDGFEQWMGLKGIAFERTESGLAAKYEKTEELVYRLEAGELSIRSFIDGKMPVFMKGSEVSWKECAELSLRFNEPIACSQAKVEFQYVEDLLILLSDSTCRLDWPHLSTDDGLSCRFYFPRISTDTSAKTSSSHECPTHFVELRDSFGDVWAAWREKREKFGSAFYLFLGTRRGYKLYAEHRFVNLVWGLEVFHRRQYQSFVTTKIQEKILRILDQIELGKDKDWLSDRLAHAHEPSLEERLLETLSTLPLDLEQIRLRKFSNRCAKLRNDVSHFGGERDGGVPYEELNYKCEALSVLYHLLLLKQVGIADDRLKWWVFEGSRSHRIKTWLVRAGLLDESILEPKPAG